MKISTKGRYALLLMIDLALHEDDGFVALKDVSDRQGITVKYLEQLAGVLNKAGYLQSMRGMGGGYRLARTPAEYGVGEILRTMEGRLAPVECAANGQLVECPQADSCPTLSFWTGLDKVINDYVDSFTLQDLAEQSRMTPDAAGMRMTDFPA